MKKISILTLASVMMFNGVVKADVDSALNDVARKKQEVQNFFDLTNSIICQSIDNYLLRDFKNLFVNFGCTGGQHRSVYFAERTAETLHEKYPQIKVVINHIVQQKSRIYEK